MSVTRSLVHQRAAQRPRIAPSLTQKAAASGSAVTAGAIDGRFFEWWAILYDVDDGYSALQNMCCMATVLLEKTIEAYICRRDRGDICMCNTRTSVNAHARLAYTRHAL